MESKIRSVLVAIAFALVSGSFSFAHAQTVIGLSGYELFKGTSSDNITRGTVFTGWTTHDGSTWYPLSSSSGGTWGITTDYQGNPGIVPGNETNSVNIIGGSWVLKTDQTTLYGNIVSGTVTWPASLGKNIGCGKGIATLNINVSASTGQTGTITGCLDDTHLNQVFPPKVWGTLTLPL